MGCPMLPTPRYPMRAPAMLGIVGAGNPGQTLSESIR